MTISILYGKDDFSATEALAALREELDGDGTLADNTTNIDGARVKPEELLAAAQTVPLLGGVRLIIVRGLLSKLETNRRPRRRKAARKRKDTEKTDVGPLAAWQPLLDALPALPASTALVFLDGELSAQNALLQALRPLAQTQGFEPLRPADLAGWTRQRAQRYGAVLEARALATLAALVGNNLRTLDSELRKLATFRGEGQISEEDVRSMVSLAREPSAFAMADAVVEGRGRDAAELLQRLLADGESPQRLLMLVARQYRLLLLAKGMLAQEIRPPEISARLRVQGFVIQRLLKQAPRYTIEQLRQAYRKLLAADLAVKRGVLDDETALQLLLAELAALARPAGRGATRRQPAMA